MIESLREVSPNILVVGDLMIDHYLWGSCERISPEAPVQVVDVQKETTVLGGAGNVINNLVTLGASVSVASVIGEDDNGQELLDMLSSLKIDTSSIVTQTKRKTSKKSRVIASNQQIIRYDRESKEDISKEAEAKLFELFAQSVERYDAIILSDYGKGVLTHTLTHRIIAIANKTGVKVFVDPKGEDYSKYKGAYTLTPNKKEASLATKIAINDNATLLHALEKLKTECELELSLITLSEDGIAILDESMRSFPTVAKEVYDVTGAGDTVIASLSFAISAGKTIDEACVFANLAAGVVVGKIGSATVTLDEIVEYEASLHK